MAAKKETETQKTTGRKQTASKRPSASSAKKTSSAPRENGKGQQKKKESVFGFPFAQEVILWGTLALSVILFISNFGIGGFVGDAISRFFFGVFGFMAYLLPLILFFMVAFSYKQQEQSSGLDEGGSGDSSGDLRLHGGGTGFKFLSGDRDFLDF